jgi:hypothetical protein
MIDVDREMNDSDRVTRPWRMATDVRQVTELLETNPQVVGP